MCVVCMFVYVLVHMCMEAEVSLGGCSLGLVHLVFEAESLTRTWGLRAGESGQPAVSRDPLALAFPA